MILNLKPYPRMRESDVAWINRIPTHWRVLRGKFLFICVDIRSERGEEELLTVSSDRGVVRRSSVSVTMFKAESYVGHKLCWPGDLVVNSLWAWAGGLGVSQYHGIVSPAYGVYRLRDSFYMYSRYIDWLVRSMPFNLELRVRSKGIWISRLQLTDEAFLNAPFPIPTEKERAAIVRFLDHADRLIQRYIRAKQKLIALLEEQNRVIIYQAITGHIDVRIGQPPREYKPSSVDGLGEMPAQWDEMSLGHGLRHVAQGWSPNAAEGELESDQWAVLSLSSIRRGVFDATAIKPIPVSAEVPDGIEVKDGDLLLTRSNTRELVGDVCIVEGARPKTVISDLIYRLTPEPAILDPRFLMFQLLSIFGRRQIERDARGSSGTMPKIARCHIRSWRVLIPPLEEQQCIVRMIKDTENTISSAVEGVQTELSLLQEYRTRLVADAVTGKLDLREAAAALSDVDPLAADALDDTLDADAPSEGDELGKD